MREPSRKQTLFSLLLLPCLLLTAGGGYGQGSSPIENASGLGHFIQALADVKRGVRKNPVLIIQYGDSHTAADLLTGSARLDFQRDFGDGGEGRAGVEFYILGVNGMRAAQLNDWSDQLFTRNVTQYSPDLIILAYGTNEVTDTNWSPESYERMFALIIRRFHEASPRSSILILGPPDRMVLEGRTWTPARRMPALMEAQRRAARQEGAAFWDMRAAMGGPGSIAQWISQGLGQRDHVHLTAAGYTLLANLFYQDFARAYNEFNAAAAPVAQPSAPEPSRIVGRSIRFHNRPPETKPQD